MGPLFVDISRPIRALVALAALLVLAACGPRDQEECISQAAQDAKSNAALQVLVGNCQRQFPAIRRDDGSYAYYDSELGEWVSVSGPTLSSADVDNIRQLRIQKTNRQAESERERQNTLSQIEISSFHITCNVDTRYIPCYDKNITVNLFNNSDKSINGITIEYEIGNNIDCSGSLGKSFYNSISIPSGGSGSIVQNVKFADAGPDGELNGCVRVRGIGALR